MTGDPNGDEKTESLTKTERATASQHGIIVDLLSGTGSGRKMAIVTLGKTASHILQGIMVDQEDVLGGIMVVQEVPHLGFTTIVILEVVGIQTVGQ